jgi:sortase A
LATESATERSLPAAGARPRVGLGDWARRGSRVLGVLLLSAAVGFGGYMAWLLWGTGLETARAQDQLRQEFFSRTGLSDRIRIGDGIAIIQIPKIELDMVVVEGIDYESLKKGPGHYPQTAYPWEKTGRTGIAGHRTTYLHPFWSLDRLQRGDRIRLLTRKGKFTYAVTRVFTIQPWQSEVLDQTAEPTLVLTTCHPRFSAALRLVVWADLVSADRDWRPVDA